MDTRKAMGLALVAIGGATLLGGCKMVKKSDYDAAIRENTELRDRIDRLQATVNDANAQIDACEGEREQLALRNRELEGQMAARPAGGSTGFEDIRGVTTSGRTDALSVAVAGDVLFGSGSATLKKSAQASLDQVASVLNSRYSGHPIRVEGYTDTDPIRKSKWKTNERLSSERALAVEAYLVGKGIDTDRIYSAAFGSSDQKATKADSRRVEIVVLGAS